jgi:hypothetical protein
VFFTFAPFIMEGLPFPEVFNQLLNIIPSVCFFTGYIIILAMYAPATCVVCNIICSCRWLALWFRWAEMFHGTVRAGELKFDRVQSWLFAALLVRKTTCLCLVRCVAHPIRRYCGLACLDCGLSWLTRQVPSFTPSFFVGLFSDLYCLSAQAGMPRSTPACLSPGRRSPCSSSSPLGTL